ARYRLLVLIEDLDVPAGHRQPHRSFADVEKRVVRDERVRLGEAVVVEHRDAVLLAEPPDRLRVERLAGRADATELLRVAPAGDRPHRSHRSRRREDVRHLMTAEEVELPVRIEPGLAPVDALERAQAPRPEERCDACRPRPFPHPLEALAVLDLVAVDELLVS